MMLMPVVVLVLLDEHVVMLILRPKFLAFRYGMLVGRFCTDWFNLDRSIVLSLVQLLGHIWLHLEDQVSFLDVCLRGAEGR